LLYIYIYIYIYLFIHSFIHSFIYLYFIYNIRKLLKLYNCLGIFVAKAMLDFRTIDLPLNTYFVKLIKDNVNNLDFSELYCLSSNKNYLEMGLKIIEQVDPPLVNSLNQIMKYSNLKKEIYSNTSLSPDELHTMVQNIKIDDSTIQDLCLDFTLPGYPDIELIENGSEVDVTNWNVEEYLKEIINFTIGKGVNKQIEAFRKGFNSVFPISNLSIFDNEELVLLFGGSENEDWSYDSKLYIYIDGIQFYNRLLNIFFLFYFLMLFYRFN